MIGWKRQLPAGRKHFHVWANRIISKAGLTATPESQKFSLCQMILGLPPQASHVSDAYFVASLRKAASNQVAEALRSEIRDAAKARKAEEEAKLAADTAQEGTVVKMADRPV